MRTALRLFLFSMALVGAVAIRPAAPAVLGGVLMAQTDGGGDADVKKAEWDATDQTFHCHDAGTNCHIGEI